MSSFRPLRGRVPIRELGVTRSDVLVLPDQVDDWERKRDQSRGIRAQSSHRGRVLALGEPAEQYGHPVPWGFSAGDEVVFVFGAKGTEESRTGVWTDGQPCVWIAQEEILAVIGHVHDFTMTVHSENDDRTREYFECRCGAWYGTCLAKRLDSNGEAAWGTPGVLGTTEIFEVA